MKLLEPFNRNKDIDAIRDIINIAVDDESLEVNSLNIKKLTILTYTITKKSGTQEHLMSVSSDIYNRLKNEDLNVYAEVKYEYTNTKSTQRYKDTIRFGKGLVDADPIDYEKKIAEWISKNWGNKKWRVSITGLKIEVESVKFVIGK